MKIKQKIDFSNSELGDFLFKVLESKESLQIKTIEVFKREQEYDEDGIGLDDEALGLWVRLNFVRKTDNIDSLVNAIIGKATNLLLEENTLLYSSACHDDGPTIVEFRLPTNYLDLIYDHMSKLARKEHEAFVTTTMQMGLGLEDKEHSPLSKLTREILAKISTSARDTDFLKEKAHKTASNVIISVSTTLNHRLFVKPTAQKPIKGEEPRYANLAGLSDP